jgi:hypothetical protein
LLQIFFTLGLTFIAGLFLRRQPAARPRLACYLYR